MHPVDSMKSLVVRINLGNEEEQKCLTGIRTVEYPLSHEVDEDHCIDDDMYQLMMCIEHAVHEFSQGRWARVSGPSMKEDMQPWFCSMRYQPVEGTP